MSPNLRLGLVFMGSDNDITLDFFASGGVPDSFATSRTSGNLEYHSCFAIKV